MAWTYDGTKKLKEYQNMRSYQKPGVQSFGEAKIASY